MAKTKSVIDTKKSNRSKILSTILNKKISRKDLAKHLNLTPASISNHINNLIKEGVIIETGEQAFTTNVGRKKKLIQIDKDFRKIFGVAIETDSVTITVANLHNEVIDSVSIKYRNPIWNEVLELISYNIKNFMDKWKLKPDQVLGVGVGIVGIIDAEAGISQKAIGLWDYPIHIKQAMKEKLNLDVVMDNNVRVLALGEQEVRDIDNDLIFIKYGPGIGASLILDGEIYSGSTFNALEFGHTISVPNGKKCYCGQLGCLETVGSYINIKTKLLENFNNTNTLSKIAKNKANVNSTTILKTYLLNDPHVVEVVEESLQHFALGLFNLIKIIDVKTVVLSGTLIEHPKVINKLKEFINEFGENYGNRLRKSAIGKNKTIGALSLVRKRLFLDTGAIFEH